MAMTKEEYAQMLRDSQRRYNETHDVFKVRTEKGIKDRIKALGYQSVNGFAVQAVEEKLEREEK